MRALREANASSPQPASNSPPRPSFLISKMPVYSKPKRAHPGPPLIPAQSPSQQAEVLLQNEVAMLNHASDTWFDDQQLRKIAASKLFLPTFQQPQPPLQPPQHNFATAAASYFPPTRKRGQASQAPAETKRQTPRVLLPHQFSPAPPAPSVWLPSTSEWQDAYRPAAAAAETIDIGQPPMNYPATLPLPCDEYVPQSPRRSPRVQNAPAIDHRLLFCRQPVRHVIMECQRIMAHGVSISDAEQALRLCGARKLSLARLIHV